MKSILKSMTLYGIVTTICSFSSLFAIPAWARPQAKTAARVTTKPAVSSSAQNISNRLPVAFVTQMMSENIWQSEFETPGTPAQSDLSDFLRGLTDAQTSTESLAEAMVKNETTYRIKIQLVRYFESAPAHELASYRLPTARLQNLKKQILQKYVDMTFSLIRMSGLAEYNPVLTELRRQMASNELHIVDLKPDTRRLWNEEKLKTRVHQYENFGLEEKRDGQYLINGLYIRDKKTLALDLSRSVFENLVTFSHEIVHAADPELIARQEKLNQHFSKIVDKLAGLIPVENASPFIRNLIQDTFLEMNRVDLLETLSKLRDVRVEKLKEQAQKDNLEGLVKDADFKGFMRNLIGVTVENEYKAYTMSLALYRVLSGKYHILPPSQSREKFIEAQFKHPHSLQFTLSVAMNPFTQGTYLESQHQAPSPQMVTLVNQLKSIFEIHYLEQSKVMISETSTAYQNLFAIIQSKTPTDDADRDMPVWTRPGKFDSLANPYQLIAAKVLSTAWVVRFKLQMSGFLSKMLGIQESLMGLRAGFIDLHDTNFGELRLIGIQPEQSTQAMPDFLPAKCRQDLDDQPTEYLSYFQETRWTPQTDITVRDASAPLRSVVSQQSVMTNLVRLNLLKAVRWLRLEMPQSQENFVSIKAFQAKLYEGQYDKSEISPARAQELMTELASYVKAAEVTVDELNRIDSLMTVVSQMYYLAIENKWQPVAEEFYKRLISSKRFFENMGFSARFSMPQIETQMKQDIQNFHQQIRSRFQACSASDRMDFYNGPEKFRLGIFQFPVTALCYNREIYLFRQTCDYNTSATTMVPNGRPESRIFIGGRAIRLDPFESFGRSR